MRGVNAMKKIYTLPEMEIMTLSQKDVIATSLDNWVDDPFKERRVQEP